MRGEPMTRAYYGGRRSFLALVIGSVFISGGAFATVTGNAYAQPTGRRRTCLTDHDTGAGADAPDYGINTGLTDIDPTDRTGRGTFSRVTDTDTSDSENRGIGSRCARRTGVTDQDSAPTADRAGYGRGGSPNRQGVGDNDPTDGQTP